MSPAEIQRPSLIVIVSVLSSGTGLPAVVDSLSSHRQALRRGYTRFSDLKADPVQQEQTKVSRPPAARSPKRLKRRRMVAATLSAIPVNIGAFILSEGRCGASGLKTPAGEPRP